MYRPDDGETGAGKGNLKPAVTLAATRDRDVVVDAAPSNRTHVHGVGRAHFCASCGTRRSEDPSAQFCAQCGTGFEVAP